MSSPGRILAGIRLKTAICLCLAACSLWNASAQDSGGAAGGPTTFELSTDMAMFAAPSTSFFFGWQRNANALFRMGFDGVTGYFHLERQDQSLPRFGVLTIFTAASLIINRAFSLTAHDIGHMETARAIGATSASLLRVGSGQVMGIGEFFLESFNFTSEPGLYWYVKNNLAWDEETRVSAEGLDTNMLTADAISAKIDDGAGHVTDLAPYLLNKLWGVSYFLETGPTSDASNYVDLLNQQGYGTVTRTNVILLNAAACLISGGFLSVVKGTYEYVANGDSRVTPLGLGSGDLRVNWPELTTWLNADNVSVSLSMDGALKNIASFRVGIDSAVLGNTRSNPELTIGARATIQRLSVGMEVTSRFAKLPFFKGGLEIDLADHFSIGLEGHYGQGNTMRELREYPLGPGAAAFIKALL